MTKIESEFNYLHNASVARLANGNQLRVGFPCDRGAFVPSGEWLIAVRDFLLPGGNGQDWEDPGAYVKAGQRFRLRRAGTPTDAAIWEIA